AGRDYFVLSSEASVTFLPVIGELTELLIDEFGESRIFCCELVCSASHFSDLRLGLLHGGAGLGLGFGCRGTLVGLLNLGSQRLLGLLCLVQICDIGLDIFS